MKSIVITGSSSGIGKATAKYFAAQGWKVAATMRKPENEKELTQIENVSLYQLDVTDQDSIDNAAEQIGVSHGFLQAHWQACQYSAFASNPLVILRIF